MGRASSTAPGLPHAALLSASAALLLSACAPEPIAGEPRFPVQPTQTIYIVLGEPPAAPVLEEPVDAWVPEEAHGDNPFERSATWLGDYDCPQGTTKLTFRVIQVRGDSIQAIFEFHHIDSGVTGRYLMIGSYDELTRKAAFSPGAWLEQPADYVTVGLKGDVALDGSLFAGRVAHPQCGAFHLRPEMGSLASDTGPSRPFWSSAY